MPEGVKGVVHCKKDPYDVYVGRPSAWGNPFTVEKHGRGEAVRLFEEYIKTRTPSARKVLGEGLIGKTLGCWCAPSGGLDIDGPLVCHAQVIARMVRGDYEVDVCPKI